VARAYRMKDRAMINCRYINIDVDVMYERLFHNNRVMINCRYMNVGVDIMYLM